MDEEKTDVPEIAIRLLAPGDEHVVRGLETYDGSGDPETLLSDPRTLMLVAFDGDLPAGFVLTEPDNESANALYGRAGGESSAVAQWDFSYAGG